MEIWRSRLWLCCSSMRGESTPASGLLYTNPVCVVFLLKKREVTKGISQHEKWSTVRMLSLLIQLFRLWELVLLNCKS